MNFSEDEITTLQPLKAALDAAHTEAASASAAVAQLQSKHNAALVERAALGGEPQPQDFGDATAWHKTVSARSASLAKLAVDIVQIEASLTAVYAPSHSLAEQVAPLENRMKQAVVQVYADRVAASIAGLIELMIEMKQLRDQLAPGFTVDMPVGCQIGSVGYGLVATQMNKTIDIAGKPTADFATIIAAMPEKHNVRRAA